MLSLLKKAKHSGYAAIIAQSGGVSMARVEQQGDRAMLVDYAYAPFVTGNDPVQTIGSVAKAHRLERFPCTTLMDIADYKLLPVEAPEVPQSELRAALRWRIRELIDFHVDDATIDVFDIPAGSARGNKDRLYAVVSRTGTIRARVDQLQNVGVNLEVIDIPELALRNIVATLPENASGVILLYFTEHQGLIILVRESTLYLARPLDVGYRDLAEPGADLERQVDMLVLEIQRSMDYYDRHFQQAQIAHLLLAPIPEEIPGLVEGLHKGLGLQVRSIQLDEVIGIAEPVNAQDAAHCFLAVGAALRTEPKRL